MKNIETIITEAGVSVTEEQLKAINEAVTANYKTVAEFEKQQVKLSTAEANVKTLTESLEKFKDIDADALNGEIETLKKTIETNKADYENKIADMAFNSVLDSAIAKAKGKDAELIKRNLDIDALKQSKNQSDDIVKALGDMAANELTKSWFESAEPAPSGKGTFPARVSNSNNNSNYLDEVYKGNPYYR